MEKKYGIERFPKHVEKQTSGKIRTVIIGCLPSVHFGIKVEIVGLQIKGTFGKTWTKNALEMTNGQGSRCVIDPSNPNWFTAAHLARHRTVAAYSAVGKKRSP